MVYPKGSDTDFPEVVVRPLLCFGCSRPLGLKHQPPAVKFGNNYIHTYRRCLELARRKQVDSSRVG